MSKAQTSFSKQSKIGMSLIAFGILVGSIAVFLLLNNNQKVPKAPSGALTLKSAPSSIRPNAQAVESYNVPPTNPKFITISAIGVVKTRIIQLGLLSNGSIAIPNNIYDTGWYNGSAKPGRNGAMFIYGHVSSWTANGVFYSLKKLKRGDTITITRGDNTTYIYQVAQTKVYAYDAVPMNTVLAPINSDKPGLNLMTCTGQIINGTSEFNQRLVVFSNLISSN